MRRGLITATAVGALAVGLGWAGAAPERSTPDPPTNPNCSPAPSGHPPVMHSQPRASLTPSAHHVTIKPGHTATVHLSIVQPAQELDTFFLEDNGTKSEFTHCAVQGGVMWATAQLAGERNLRVGMGNFGDYAGFSEVEQSGGVSIGSNVGGVYFLDSAIRPPDDTFFTDVTDLGNNWESGWHSTTGDQGALEAVLQAATGVGKIVAPGDPDNIPAHQDAGFHTGAFPVVVLLAADWFDTSARTTGYPGPDFDTVSAALRARGIRLVGVWMDNTNNKENNGGEPYDGRADVRVLVTNSGAHTASPLTCGRYQTVPAGGLPMCVFAPPADMTSNPGGSGEPHQMGPMLRNLVASLANPQPVSVNIISGSSVVSAVAAGRRPAVDILKSHTLQSTVTFHCPSRLAGHTVRVRLGEMVAGQPRADTLVAVTCQRPPAKGPQAPTFLAAPVAAAVAAANPPGPGPATQLQVNPNPAPNPNPGFATAEEQEGAMQVAHADGESPTGETETLAMSRPTSARTEDGLFVGAALTLFGAAGAVAVRRRCAGASVSRVTDAG